MGEKSFMWFEILRFPRSLLDGEFGNSEARDYCVEVSVAASTAMTTDGLHQICCDLQYVGPSVRAVLVAAHGATCSLQKSHFRPGKADAVVWRVLTVVEIAHVCSACFPNGAAFS